MILSDSVPAWIVVGALATSGWMYEIVSGEDATLAALHSDHRTNIRVLEEKTDDIETDIRDIKGSLIRIEEYIREK